MENKQLLEKFEKIMEDFRKNANKICDDYKNQLNELEKEVKDNK
jgi:F0F1-type ATP synthase membrane subunit b/b'